MEVDREKNPSVPNNQVYRQDPSGEADQDCNFLGFSCSNPTVTLTVSGGPGQTEVPDVTGLSQDDAEQELEDAGFTTSIETRTSSDVDSGLVIETDPAGGEMAGAAPGHGDRFQRCRPGQGPAGGRADPQRRQAAAGGGRPRLLLQRRAQRPPAGRGDRPVADRGDQGGPGSTVTPGRLLRPGRHPGFGPGPGQPDPVLGGIATDGRRAGPERPDPEHDDPAAGWQGDRPEPGSGTKVAEGSTVVITVGKYEPDSGTTGSDTGGIGID